jgi:AcrR family transcriptional regulator
MTAPTGQAISEPVRRGRPRSEKARQSILKAAADLLLARGLGAVSMDTVAEQAGVSKATIYRWWPTKETLALDALFVEWDSVRPAPVDTGPLREDLLSLIRPWVRLVSEQPYARVIAALINAAATDPEFARLYRERVVQPRREQAHAIFAHAIDRGEIPADTDIDVAIDLLYGPLYHRLLHGHAPLTELVGEQVIDMLLGGLHPRPADPRS